MAIIGLTIKEGQECDSPNCTAPAEYGIYPWKHVRVCCNHASMFSCGIKPPKFTRDLFDKIDKERGEEDATV